MALYPEVIRATFTWFRSKTWIEPTALSFIMYACPSDNTMQAIQPNPSHNKPFRIFHVLPATPCTKPKTPCASVYKYKCVEASITKHARPFLLSHRLFAGEL